MNDFGLSLNGARLQAHFWIGIYYAHCGKREIFGPLTLLGFLVVDPYFLRSIAVKSTLGSCRPARHAA